MAAESARMSPTGTASPSRPSSNDSGNTPMLLTTSGFASTSASTAALQKLSHMDGSTMTSACFSAGYSRSGGRFGTM